MLKPADPQPNGERPVGELVHQLIEDGKSYARAELGLVKATASAKASAVKLPAVLFAVAFLLVQAAFAALAVSVFVALAPRFGPILAGLLAFLLFAGIAGGLAWFGAKKLQEDL